MTSLLLIEDSCGTEQTFFEDTAKGLEEAKEHIRKLVKRYSARGSSNYECVSVIRVRAGKSMDDAEGVWMYEE